MKTVTLAGALAIAATGSRAAADEPALAHAPAPSAQDDAGPGPIATRCHDVGRLSVVGTYRGLWGLSLAGGGVELSIGGETKSFTVFVNGRFIDMRTADGLVALEGTLSVTFEESVGAGFRLGAGLGGTYLTVERATSGSPLQSLGPMVLGRLWYDFGDAPNLFLLGDLEGQLQASGAFVWGPTLQAGLRF